MNYIKITKNDIANGPGVRVTLWVTGCTIHCNGCHNPQTWDFNAGKPLQCIVHPVTQRVTRTPGPLAISFFVIFI